MPVFSKRDLKKLIIPLIIEQALALTIGMADTMMVSSCGEAAVSGISLVDSINQLLIAVFSALATGGSVAGFSVPIWGGGKTNGQPKCPPAGLRYGAIIRRSDGAMFVF